MTVTVAPRVSVNDLPQGPEFRFITGITVFAEDKLGHPYIEVVYNFYPRKSDWGKAHFPENPIMPGVLLGEMAGQAGILLVKHLGVQGLPLLAELEIKLKQPVRPGDNLTGQVTLVNRRDNIFKFEFIIHKLATGICVAKGQLTGVAQPTAPT